MTADEVKSLVGSELGTSEWMLVDQSRIDDFARVTEDFNFIHVDPEKAAATAFGGTIAHGLLTLSLIVHLCWDFVPSFDGTQVLLNYGFDKVRFIAPVTVDSRIRAAVTLLEVRERKPKQWLVKLGVKIEVESAAKAQRRITLERKTALVAEWLSLHVTD